MITTLSTTCNVQQTCISDVFLTKISTFGPQLFKHFTGRWVVFTLTPTRKCFILLSKNSSFTKLIKYVLNNTVKKFNENWPNTATDMDRKTRVRNFLTSFEEKVFQLHYFQTFALWLISFRPGLGSRLKLQSAEAPKLFIVDAPGPVMISTVSQWNVFLSFFHSLSLAHVVVLDILFKLKKHITLIVIKFKIRITNFGERVSEF